MHSDPNLVDTDGDGYDDSVDAHPKIKDRITYSLGHSESIDASDFFDNGIGYIHVIGSDGDLYYGGNQAWFNDIQEWGCGIIAANDVGLYVNNGEADYSFTEYNNSVNRCLNNVYSIPFTHSMVPIVDAVVVERILSDRGITADLTFIYDYNSEDVLDRIITSIKDDKPVIMLEADLFNMMLDEVGSYDLLNGLINGLFRLIDTSFSIMPHDSEDQETEDEQQIEIKPGVSMYEGDKNNCEIETDPCNKMSWHYVTITGVYINNNTNKIYLRIQSWGKMLYIDYDEFVDYNDSVFRQGGLFFID